MQMLILRDRKRIGMTNHDEWEGVSDSAAELRRQGSALMLTV